MSGSGCALYGIVASSYFSAWNSEANVSILRGRSSPTSGHECM